MARVLRKVGEPSAYHVTIPQWPKEERPREKLLQQGPGALTDAELLAILVRTGAGKITAVDVAATLLREYGPLGYIAARTCRELRRYKGIGEAKAALLVAAFELGRRMASEKRTERLQINGPGDIVGRYLPLVRDLKHEVFMVLLLDSANHLLRDVTVSAGILNSSVVHPREVFQPAILEPAAGIILVHNHPSGNPQPSQEDLGITRQIVDAGRILGIPVHDHVILAIDKYTSFAERGLL